MTKFLWSGEVEPDSRGSWPGHDEYFLMIGDEWKRIRAFA